MNGFDAFCEEGGYTREEAPQAFADWLSSLTGAKVDGFSSEGAVTSKPSEEREP